MPTWAWKILFKRIIPRLIDEFKRRRDWKKIDEYVNKPNELDKQLKDVNKQLKQSYKTVVECCKYIEQNDKDIAILKQQIKKLKRSK